MQVPNSRAGSTLREIKRSDVKVLLRLCVALPKGEPFYVGLNQDLLVRVQQHIAGWYPKRSASPLAYILGSCLDESTQLNGSTISKAHGVSVISKPDLLTLSQSRSWGWHCACRDAGLAVPLAEVQTPGVIWPRSGSCCIRDVRGLPQ